MLSTTIISICCERFKTRRRVLLIIRFQGFQGMASASGGQYGQMMMKMESASMSMDQQQSYSSAAAQMSMSQGERFLI